MAEAIIEFNNNLTCDHEKDLRFAYLFARCGYGNTVTFACRDCRQEVTEAFKPDSPYRNWTTPNYQEPWDNVGGPRSPEIKARFETAVLAA